MNNPSRLLLTLGIIANLGGTSLSMAATAPEAVPTLRNPSFEVAGATPKEVLGWGLWGGGIERVDQWSPTHEGVAMVGYKHWVISDAGDSGLFQDAGSITAGGAYDFSLWIFVDQTKDHAFGGIELRLESTVDGHQATVATNTTAGADIPAGHWVKLNVRGIAPVANLRIVVVFYPAPEAPRSGAVKIDDARITKLP